MKLNFKDLKLLLIHVKSFIDFMQLSFAIGKSPKIFIILLLKGKLYTIGFANLDWLII